MAPSNKHQRHFKLQRTAREADLMSNTSKEMLKRLINTLKSPLVQTAEALLKAAASPAGSLNISHPGRQSISFLQPRVLTSSLPVRLNLAHAYTDCTGRHLVHTTAYTNTDVRSVASRPL